jgi:hypothetical protein
MNELSLKVDTLRRKGQPTLIMRVNRMERGAGIINFACYSIV